VEGKQAMNWVKNATSGIVKRQGVNVNEQEEKMEMVRKKMVVFPQE